MPCWVCAHAQWSKAAKAPESDRRWLATNNASGIFTERLVVALFGDVIHQR